MMDPALSIIGEVFGVDQETSFNILIVLSSLLLGIFVIFVFFIIRRKPTQKTVYITGVSDSGKSVLFSNLITGGRASPTTVTSQKENIFDDFSTSQKKTLRLVDVPGADKVRSSILNTNLKVYPAAGLIYVVDSGTVVKDCREVAEFLYEVLADTSGVADRRNFPILIVCNKQDAPTAKSANVVKSTLEKEFAILNHTRSAALDHSGGAGGRKRELLGDPGADFSFKQVPQKIEFVECTAKGVGKHKANVSAVEKWLDMF